jgi:hypothetical protein
LTTTGLSEALAILQQELVNGDLELGSFTDAEIAAVTPFVSRGNRLVPLLALDALEDADRSVAIEAARASLVDRGYFVEGEPGEATDELAAILEFRSNPSAVVIVDRMSHVKDDYSLYLYGIGSAGYLCELSREDRHDFVVRSTEATVDVLIGVVDPQSDAEPRDGPQMERAGDVAPPGWEKLEAAINATHTITRLSSSRKVAPDTVEDAVVSFAAGSAGVWGYSGYSDEHGAAMYARSLSAPSIRDALAAFLGAGDIAVSLD